MEQEGPKLKWLTNDTFHKGEDDHLLLHPAFAVSKDYRLIPLVTGLPFEPDKNGVDWDLYEKEHAFGIYIREDSYQFLDHDKPPVFIDAVTATGILALPKEKAQEMFKRIMERARE